MNRMSWIVTITMTMLLTGIGVFQAAPDEAALAMTQAPLTETSAYTEADGNQATGQPHFQTINGLSLTDDLKTVFEMKGQPLSIKQDEILPSLKTYTFEDCSIIMTDGSIEYVVVPASVGKLDIDGQLLPMDIVKLKEKLGKPYFVSEDGIVYKDGVNVLKIYTDTVSGKVTSVHYFHEAAQ
ncbi:hypothetical protein [Paenibacillus sp. UNC451MF]|uniref:hypothetical protein n=1 Tax=Paenibacillus sp. UNC451MF TaxID=1449063 RepID=UPI000690F524|nr:hypothetical protein [Paenibacillus sp. UNC451MF]